MLNPMDLTALHSLDFGNVYSLDGREHPVTATTPVYAVDVPPLTSPDTVGVNSSPSGPTGTTAGGTLTQASFGWPSLPSHIGARTVVGILAVGILLIVVFRLIK